MESDADDIDTQREISVVMEVSLWSWSGAAPASSPREHAAVQPRAGRQRVIAGARAERGEPGCSPLRPRAGAPSGLRRAVRKTMDGKWRSKRHAGRNDVVIWHISLQPRMNGVWPVRMAGRAACGCHC